MHKENNIPYLKKALTLVEWMFPHLVNTETIMSLYRTRWQIELVFKRLNTLLSLSELRAKLDSPLAEIYLYGKLLYAAMMACFSLCDVLSPIAIQKIQKSMRERRRKRKLQTTHENIIRNLIKDITINNNVLS